MIVRRAGRLLSALLLTASMTVLGGIQFTPSITNVSASPLERLDPRLRAHVSGTAEEALAPAGASQRTDSSNYFPSGDDGCPTSIGSNIKVNQNCLNISPFELQGRSQAQNETSIAADPNNPQHLIASYNDYRRGDGTCGSSYTLNGGASWADATTPNGFTNGHDPAIRPSDFGADRQYWQAGGDTSVAWDSRGNAYLSCQVFMRGKPVTSNADASSGFLVFRSTKNNGGSWNFPGHYVTATQDLVGAQTVLEDKQLMTVDNNPGSPFRDRIYITWTHYNATSAYIYGAFSKDYGETFSAPHLISPKGKQPLCPAPFSPGGGCDNNQFSQPFVAPDGTLYVVYSNFNTAASATSARYQVLIQKSTDGGMTFDAPQKVTDYYELPDCATYQGGQNSGRACVPEKGSSQKSVFRATQYASAAVNPEDPSRISVTVGSYINADSREANGCKPTGVVFASQGGLYDGVKTAGACANHILLSTSSDGGTTFNGTTTDPRQMPLVMTGEQAHTDQWFQWLTYSNHRLAVSQYDRQYGNDETTGASDISLAGSVSGGEPDQSLAAVKDQQKFAVARVTTSPMPPPTQFSGVFWGDYSGMTAVGDTAYPLWSDSRSPDLFVCPGSSPPRLCGVRDPNGIANDTDIFVRTIQIPGGGERAR